ncbi:MAG TPA: NUDIX domain-containing protein [bacterium]|nr:MAG: NUDIX domain protein [Parcubacteria group bacterium ADurb.Bin016]HNQ45240.1 NUDIX domain-containing protein [bacterium]HNU90045.1 NUDIX domain-containing protein [bacterium]HPU92246.1 NUDIX domain-containing protein [bacterium]HPX64466.1 NUDIX domain-containing protein [bacterium]
MRNKTGARPAFQPSRDQTDYTHARWAPVINCVVKYGSKILVVRRNPDLNFYPGYWNGISGFLDDQQSLKEKIYSELSEELGLTRSQIVKIKVGEIFDQDDPQYNKTWVVHPVLVEVKTDKVKLDWEASNYKWLTPLEVKKLKLLPNFIEVLNRLNLV